MYASGGAGMTAAVMGEWAAWSGVVDEEGCGGWKGGVRAWIPPLRPESSRYLTTSTGRCLSIVAEVDMEHDRMGSDER